MDDCEERDKTDEEMEQLMETMLTCTCGNCMACRVRARLAQPAAELPRWMPDKQPPSGWYWLRGATGWRDDPIKYSVKLIWPPYALELAGPIKPPGEPDEQAIDDLRQYERVTDLDKRITANKEAIGELGTEAQRDRTDCDASIGSLASDMREMEPAIENLKADNRTRHDELCMVRTRLDRLEQPAPAEGVPTTVEGHEHPPFTVGDPPAQPDAVGVARCEARRLWFAGVGWEEMTKQIDTLIAAVRAADAEGKEEYFAVRKSGFSHLGGASLWLTPNEPRASVRVCHKLFKLRVVEEVESETR